MLTKCIFTLDENKRLWYNSKARINLGVAQLVARYLGVVEAAGSSPVTQTTKSAKLCFRKLCGLCFLSH